MRWLAIVEVWLVTRLLQSPTFHRAVRKVHKKVHEIQRGEKLVDPSSEAQTRGGTNIDRPRPDLRRFLKHYMDELKDQFRGIGRR
ncbi:uncharacterized protein L3040_003768 [Drepanopeziza brunnea f. sp. 'multigermtubi']|uniref:uncharacterized protein n=1 Tax=Drepanopeziza brunnea f. sp. 'multigermtubi' TaxID=698441 RepID=UPI00239E751A|nr:hypothetical protein L3040_003768 [Drepanopeziza brunnea f. sp. 'multigermtubi']